MNLRKTTVTLAAGMLLGALAATAQTTAASAFVDAPKSVFPLLDQSARLDMLDYFNSGMSNPTTNALDGKSRITSATPARLEISMTDASTYQINILPAEGGDTLVALISTVATPAPDSRMSIYSRDWSTNLTGEVFARPRLADWLTSEGKKRSGEVEALVPFLLVSYSYDPATGLLTLTNNTSRFLSADVYEIVEPCFRKALVYKWNNKKFVPAS